MNLDEMLVRSHPGDGVVARFPGVVLVALPASATQETVTDQLLALAETAAAGGPAPGRRLARQVVGVLASADPDDVPPLCLLAQADTGLAVILQGTMDADVTGPAGMEKLSGGQVATWVDRILPPTVTALVVTPTGSSAPHVSPRARLAGGVVSGSGVSIVPAGVEPTVLSPAAAAAAPAAVAEPAPVAVAQPAPADAVRSTFPPPIEPAVATEMPPVAEAPPPPPPPPPPALPADPVPAAAAADASEATAAASASAAPPASLGEQATPVEPKPFVAAPLTPPEPEELRSPLPIAGPGTPVHEEPSAPKVRGVICSRGHFNDPAAPFCAVCGISMVQRTLNLVEGPRPPLGVIVFDDGTTFTLDSDYVIGREPDNDPSVTSGNARPLTIEDPDRTVSRVHAGLVIDGWAVKAVDRGSANGTYIAGPGEDDWVALVPNRPTAIKPGTRVRLGQRVLLFDSHRGVR